MISAHKRSQEDGRNKPGVEHPKGNAMTSPISVVPGTYFDEGERDCDNVTENTKARPPEAACSPKGKLNCRLLTCFTPCISIDFEPLDEISNPILSSAERWTVTVGVLGAPDILPF